MEGQGSCVSAVVATTYFFPYIGVYSGLECNTMSCAAEEIYDDHKVTFFAANGTTYRIVVGGADSDYDFGDYTLTVLVSFSIVVCFTVAAFVNTALLIFPLNNVLFCYFPISK